MSLLQVHDSLVAQSIDPASDTYYAAIEAQVAQAMPDKWAQWQAIMAAAAGGPIVTCHVTVSK